MGFGNITNSISSMTRNLNVSSLKGQINTDAVVSQVKNIASNSGIDISSIQNQVYGQLDVSKQFDINSMIGDTNFGIDSVEGVPDDLRNQMQSQINEVTNSVKTEDVMPNISFQDMFGSVPNIADIKNLNLNDIKGLLSSKKDSFIDGIKPDQVAERFTFDDVKSKMTPSNLMSNVKIPKIEGANIDTTQITSFDSLF